MWPTQIKTQQKGRKSKEKKKSDDVENVKT